MLIMLLVAFYSNFKDKDGNLISNQKPVIENEIVKTSSGMIGEIIEINSLLKEIIVQEITPSNLGSLELQNSGLFGTKKIKVGNAIVEKLFLDSREGVLGSVPSILEITFGDLVVGSKISISYTNQENNVIEEVEKITWMTDEILELSSGNEINKVESQKEFDWAASINFREIEGYNKLTEKLNLIVTDFSNNFLNKFGEKILEKPYADNQNVEVSLEKVTSFYRNKIIDGTLEEGSSVELVSISKNDFFSYLDKGSVSTINLSFENLPDINKELKPELIIIFTK